MKGLIEQPQALDSFQKALFDILLFGNGIKDMLTLAENYLEAGIFLYDINYNIISASPEAARHQEHIQKTAKKMHLNDTEVSRMKKYNVFEDLEKNPTAFYAHDKDYPEQYWILCAVRIRNAFIGYVISPCKEVGNSRKLSIMTLLSQALSIELQKTNLFSYKTGIKYSYFLNNLINGEFEDERVIRSRMEIIEKKAGTYHRLICISASDSVGSNDLHPSITEEARNCFSNAISTLFEGNLVLLVSDNQPLRKEGKGFSGFEKFLRYHHLKAGVSQEYADLVKTPTEYWTAKNILQVGINQLHDSSIFFAEDHLFYQILSCCDKKKLKALLYDPYLQIRRYDKEFHTEFTKTLRLLLQCGRSANAAAEALHIHRSTLFYRIKNIEELFGISLSDTATLFALEISFEIDAYLTPQSD